MYLDIRRYLSGTYSVDIASVDTNPVTSVDIQWQ